MSEPPAPPERPWTRAPEEVLEGLGVDAGQGLDDDAVRRRRRRYGPNRLRETAARPGWRILVNQLQSVVVMLLLAAALAAAVFGRVVEALAIAAAIVVNTIIGFVMELRATRAMEALQRMGQVTARVRRNGEIREVAADDLVPGDMVLLEAGDMVPADLRLLEVNRLQCDEAALTGESLAVDKAVEAVEDRDAPIGDRTAMAYKGSAVTMGSGMGAVVATGMATELGRVSRLVSEAEQAATPLEKRIDDLGRRLVWLTIAIAVVVAAAGALAGKELLVMLETAIALAIAAVPEGLPVVATLALARGMGRMARRNAVVKRLSAVETLGAADLIFTDKTGTLTENHMTLARLALERGVVTLEDDGRFMSDDEALTPADAPELAEALETGALCNNASLGDDGAVGDPTEVALLEAAAAADIRRDALLEAQPEAREVSFDPEVKMMATFHRREDGLRVAVKGAPEAVLDHCARQLGADGETELDDPARDTWRERGERLADHGLRVLALARGEAADVDAEPYEDLVLVGLAGLYDPPRPGIADTLDGCRRAGIRVVMGTGDHGATGRAIAREIGLARADDEVVEAAELAAPDAGDEDTRRRLLEAAVFARISPEQKLDLISLYQEAGRVVAMTGDGVNDAPGLKKADIGIAMGRRGTEVAKEAADMVLRDDAFETILVAVEHGRTIFANIRRFIIYLLSGNLSEIMAISAAALVAAPLPLLPLQILYINFVSDVMPALALGLSRSESGVMEQPPRAAAEPILLRRHWVATAGYGVIIAAAVLGAFATALAGLDMTVERAVTISFLTFGFARLWHVFNMRGPTEPVIRNTVTTNGFVWLALAIGVALLLGAAYLPVLAGVLSMEAPGAVGWALAMGFSLLPLAAVQLMKQAGIAWEAPSPSRG